MLADVNPDAVRAEAASLTSEGLIAHAVTVMSGNVPALLHGNAASPWSAV